MNLKMKEINYNNDKFFYLFNKCILYMIFYFLFQFISLMFTDPQNSVYNIERLALRINLIFLQITFLLFF